MNITEAKFILESYRHHGGDANDPQFREALKLAQRDGELSKWLSEQTAFDAAISGKIKTITAPSDLKAKILAGRKIVTPTPWWRQSTWIAAAACFLLLLGFAAFFLTPTRGENFAQYRSDMTDFLSTRLDRLDMDTPDMTKIRDFLGQHGGQSDLVLPERIAELRKLGCRVLDWHGQKVTLVCFKQNGPHEVHMLVADGAHFRNAPKGSTPEYTKSGDWMTASWSRDGKVYVLAGMGDRAALQKYL